MASLRQRLGGAAIFASPFRPFYLFGALYAPLVAAGGAGAWAGWVDLGAVAGGVLLWHGHEMLFGFAAAIVAGTLLTALPSWAGIAELRGLVLGALVIVWLFGRVAFWLSPWLPGWVVALADAVFYPAMLALLARPLWQVRNRLYRLVLPILGALAVADIVYHAGVLAGRPDLAAQALRAAVWALVVLYTLKGGVLTPVFTGNALRVLDRGEQARFRMPLEVLACGLLLALAVADLAGASPMSSAALATGCVLVHGWRVLRWQGWRAADQPLLPSMHLGFAWLLAAFALKAMAELGVGLREPAWIHAFTVGALGLMMLSLMTRVSLRHTGRALEAPWSMKLAAAAVFCACTLRLAAALDGIGTWAIASAATLWAAAFVVYLVRFGRILVKPSLPRPD